MKINIFFNKTINKLRDEMSFLICLFFILCKPLLRVLISKNEKIWLISEKPEEARDNGIVFFNYLSNVDIDRKIFYVITKDSYDLDKIKNVKQIIFQNSIKHYFYFAICECIVSSQMHTGCPYPHIQRIKFFKKYNKDLRIVFLQHGVIKDHFGLFTKKRTFNDLFICGAKPEFDYLSENCGYDLNKAEIVYTGLPRYDAYPLEVSCDIDTILIFPTFRKWLVPDKFNDFKSSLLKFQNSDFFISYKQLLTNKKLIELLKSKKIKIYFYLHYSLQPYSHLFESDSDLVEVLYSNKSDLRNYIQKCNLLITDRSSIAFDFAFMKKPVIYFDFDKSKYQEEHYLSGYFDYERDGFGPVNYDLTSVINCLSDYIKYKKFPNKDFNNNIEKFFTLRDNKNCERVLRAILNMLKLKRKY
jgi:CDP-glycerol glycerophosphotransferase